MEAIDILTYIENDFINEHFIDLRIMNNSVVGFYKTHTVKYDNIHGITESYLFPTTFIFNNGKIETSMVLGSVEKYFQIPILQYAIDFETNLVTSGVSNHLHKLLIAKQRLDNSENELGCLINTKAFMAAISELDSMGFPFMRITNNDALIR